MISGMSGPRGFAAVTLGVLLLALVLVFLWRIPWSSPPAPRADQLAAKAELPADAVARGKAYHDKLRPASYLSLALSLLAALVLGLTPLGSWLVRQVGRPFGGHWLAEAILGGLVVVLLIQVVLLPISAWAESIRRQYGISTQDWSGWWLDVLKSGLVSAVLGGIVLAIFYTLTHFAPRWWWAWAAAGAAGLVVLLTFVMPVVIAPIFNKFTPMSTDDPLRARLIALADADGVPVKDVLVADASRRTTAVNAYVAGLGPTRRIVIYDTLLAEATPDEVVAVAAHELGHAKDQDVFTGTLLSALGAATFVCALYLLGGWTGLLRRAGLTEGLTSPRSIALLVAISAVLGLVSLPFANLVSRRIEARADAHALALTREPEIFASMQRRLALHNLSNVDPAPIDFLLFGSHPSTVQRIAAARAYARTHPQGARK